MDNPFEILIQQNAEIIRHLQELKISGIYTAPTKESIPEEDLKLSCAELSLYLKKTITTIYRYKKNRVFPWYQAGRTVFFKKSEVDAAMSSLPKTKKGAKNNV